MTPRVKIFRPAANPLSSPLAGIGLPARGQSLFLVVKAGLDASVFNQLASLMGTSPKKLAQWLGMSSSTFYRRLKRGRFGSDESDRTVRAAKMFSESVSLFDGDQGAARIWIRTPLKGLNGKAPVQLLQTGVECQALLDLIGRLENGVFS